jgi:hypothetical protein
MLSKQPGDRFPSITSALTALGATRMSMHSVEDALGLLAVPLPGEEGVIIVRTPASPAPLASAPAAVADVVPEPSSTGVRRFATLRSAIVKARMRLVDATRATVGAIAAGWQRTGHSAGRAGIRTRAAAQALRAWAVGVPRPSRAVVAGAGGFIVLAGTVAAGVSLANRNRAATRRPIANVDSVRAAAPDSSAPKMTVADSSSGALVDSIAGIDSSTALEPVDSAVAVVDSSVPRRITVTYTSRRKPVVAGDTVEFAALGRGLNGRTVRIVRVTWYVSDTAIATINKAGVLITRRPGTVSVFAGTETLTGRLGLMVTPHPAGDRVVAADSVKRDSRTDGPDAAADSRAVDGAVTAFVSTVLPSKNTDETRRLHRGRDASDAELDELLRIIGAQKTLRIRPQGNPPPPTITGDRATADVRIGLSWRKALGRWSEDIPWLVHVDLERIPAGWRVTGFRLSRPRA